MQLERQDKLAVLAMNAGEQRLIRVGGATPGLFGAGQLAISAPTLVPVGLFGLQTMTSRVRSVTAAAMATKSCTSSAFRGTGTPCAPIPRITIGYMAKDGQA